MTARFRRLALGLCACLAAAVAAAAQAPPQPPQQTPPPAAPAPAGQPAPAPAPTAPGATASQQPTRPSFRSGVDVVSLNVTVTDQSRNFVTSLEQGDFVVFEDGVKQDLTYFNKSQLPVALSLLVDTSASMEDKLKLAQEAAIGFIRRMKIGRASG